MGEKHTAREVSFFKKMCNWCNVNVCVFSNLVDIS